MSRSLSSADSQLSLKFQSECLKDSQDTRYGRLIELKSTCTARSVSSINALMRYTVALTWPVPKCGTPDPKDGRWRVGRRLCRLWRLHFIPGFRVHVLPITDKGEAVLCSMWFHLEQVKQCRKIDPSSVAFQRPVRNSAKS